MTFKRMEGSGRSPEKRKGFTEGEKGGGGSQKFPFGPKEEKKDHLRDGEKKTLSAPRKKKEGKGFD